MTRASVNLRAFGRSTLMVVLACLVSGCAMSRHPQVVLGPKYKPSNVHHMASILPTTVRRVVVLPISAAATDWQADMSRIQLQEMLHTELGKSRRFELVPVSPAQVQSLTGRPGWSAHEALPANFLQSLQEAFDCQAVLFAHLSTYNPYRPLVMGWNLKLVDVTGHHVLWAADEVFDANQTLVSNAAQYYYLTHTPGEKYDAERSAILLSPRLYAQYTLSALFETLPK